MTLKGFFVGRGIVFAILILVGLGFFAYQLFVPEVIAPVNEEAMSQEEYVGPATFTWRFEEADSLNPDGNPNTDIFLEAVYVNGVAHSKRIDTTPSSCNEVEDNETELATVSSTIVCYGAGLGYYFVVTQSDSEYLVQR